MIEPAISETPVWTLPASLVIYEHEHGRFWCGLVLKNARPGGGDILMHATETYDSKEDAKASALDWLREQAN